MQSKKWLIKWLQRGQQRRAVAKALTKAKTPKYILSEAKQHAPKIRDRNVCYIIRDFEKMKLAYCLNPTDSIGRLYFYTDSGRTLASKVFEKTIYPLPKNIDWYKYSKIVRATARHVVFEEIGKSRIGTPKGKTVSMVKKALRDTHPIYLNSAIQAFKELRSFDLITCIGTTKKRSLNLYQLTEIGKQIWNELKR